MADDNNLDINIGINPAGAESGARRTSAAVSSVVSETKDLDAAFRRLKSAIDPTFAATDRFNKSQAEYNNLLKAGKIDQAEYAKYMDVLKRAYESQISSIEKNSSAARQAAADKKALLVQEARDREAAAAQQKSIAAEWVAQERRNTQALKTELAQRTLAQKAAIAEAAAAASAAAQASVAGTRAGGTPVTKAAETQQIREAAAAAKQAARERVAAEKEADAEILAAYAASSQAAKSLAQEAAAEAVSAAQARGDAEKQVAEAVAAVEVAQRREATQAAREAAAAATQAAKSRLTGEKELEGQLKQRAIAEAEAAAAAMKDAKALNEMRQSIDPAFAAQERYNATMQKATQLLMQNALREGEWTTIQKQATVQQDINTRSLGRMNQTGIQLGYQMQDVTASIASGINPLVIFAQQSGQVAYAMQGMGGMAGKVAGIMGGIWFQAILGAVIILDKLWGEHDKGKKKTLDLMDAEARRTATVLELNKALDQYVRSQHAANLETEAAHRLTLQNLVDDQNEINNKWKIAQDKLTQAKQILADMQKEGPALGEDPTNFAAAMSAQVIAVNRAQEAVNDLREAHDKAADAAAEGAISAAKAIASLTPVEQEHGRIVDGITKAYFESTRTQLDYIAMTNRLRTEEARYNAAKAAESAKTRADLKDEAQLYKSREDAILRAGRALQAQGYKVSENPHFGGVTPGVHKGVAHRGGFAIDVNAAPGYGETTNPAIKAKMDLMVRQYQAAGFKVLWNGKVYPGNGGPTYDIPANQDQHKDHAHIESTKEQVGQPAGMGLARGIVSEEDQLARERIRIAHQTADELVEVYDTAMSSIANNEELTNEEKLAKLLELEEKRKKAITDGYGSDSKQVEQAKQHELATIKRYNDLIVKAEEDRENRVLALRKIQEGSAANTDQNRLGMKSDVIDFKASTGIITARQEVIERKALLDQEYQNQVTHELAMNQLVMNNLQAKLNIEGQDREHIAQINQEIETNTATHLANMTQMQQEYARNVAKSQQAAASITMNRWREVTNTFTSALSQGLQGLWMRQQTIGGALLNLADQLVFKFMDMGIQMLSNWIMAQLGMKAASVATNTAEVATHTATEAAKTAVTTGAIGIRAGAEATAATVAAGIGAATRVSEVVGYSGVAGAAAFASTAAIPIIGPALAPGAAAAAVAATMAFAPIAAASGGWGEIDRDQMAMVHKKEMILPAWIAEPFRKSLSAPNSGAMMSGIATAGENVRSSMSTTNGGNNFYYQPKNTAMHANFSDLLSRDGRTLRKWFHNEVRNGGLKLK